MAKKYRTHLPEQDLLLPPSLRDWLPENHLAYFVSDLIDQVDLIGIEAYYEQEEQVSDTRPDFRPSRTIAYFSSADL